MNVTEEMVRLGYDAAKADGLTGPRADCERLVALILTAALSPPTGEREDGEVERVRDALWDHFCPGIRRLDCDDEFYEAAARIALASLRSQGTDNG